VEGISAPFVWYSDHAAARAADKAEIERLRTAVADKVVATTMLTDMAVENGSLTLELEGGMAKVLAESLAAQYAKGGGPNYIELTFMSQIAVPGEKFVVTVQRCEGETPHQLRQKAEARIAELEAYKQAVMEYRDVTQAHVPGMITAFEWIEMRVAQLKPNPQGERRT